MMSRTVLAILLWGQAVITCAAVGAPTANTTYGPIVGITTGTGTAFLGVPFAAPPVRWGPPTPPKPWVTPLNTVANAPSCVQFSYGNSPSNSEDCLYLNVYVPSVRSPGNPLIIFIHGGGFVTGGAATDFSLYANGTGAVIVSVAYRLGSLGFLTLPGMAPAFPTPMDPTTAISNVGLLDQQTALLWVHENAAAFGADPANVIVTGQSAGGSSVLFQLTLPASYPAYKAAMPQSPGAPVNTLVAGQATATGIANRLGCPATGGFAVQIACLRAVPVQSVVTAALAQAGTGNLPLTLGPVVDGALVTAVPAVAMLAGNFNTEASIIVTETLFEGDSLLVGFTHTVTMDAAQYATAANQFGIQVGFNASATAAISALYLDIAAADGYFNGSTRLWGDGLISCTAAWAAQGAARHSSHPAYRLLWNGTLPGQPAGRATHGSDLPFLFDYGLSTALEKKVRDDIHGYLVNEAVSGDVNSGPRGPGPVHWPAFSPGSPSTTLVVNELAEYSTVTSWQEDYCATWLAYVP